MIIGVDLDNTIVNYDKLIYSLALKKSLIPKEVGSTKKEVRDYLRSIGKENAWTELQGFIYGPGILEANPFPGVLDFFKNCRNQEIKIYIISHKTKYPFLGEKYDLHEYAKKWLEKQGFHKTYGIGLPKENVFLELTKEDKINRIKELKCTHFIDDLPEFLAEKGFPKDIKKILFDPNNKYKDIRDFEQAQSWVQVMEIIKNAPTEDFKQKAGNLIKKLDISDNFTISQIHGGKNNKVFCINIQGEKKFLLKSYFKHPEDSRNRLKNEFYFSEFAWDNGLRCLHKPYAYNPTDNLGLYQFIEGRKIKKDEISQKFIDQALFFFIELNKHKDSLKAKELPNASEACFSINEHLATVKKRINNLKGIDVSSEINKKAISFVDELSEKWQNVHSKAEELINKNSLDKDETVEKCLSPSDFGFHNAILDKDDNLFFIDFEYAGWDDPAKMVCDFFCQPEIPIPLDYFDNFTDKIFSSEKDKLRTKILLPVYKVKWCCIMLNEFLKEGSSRRSFAQENSEKKKIIQLDKVKEYFKQNL